MAQPDVSIFGAGVAGLAFAVALNRVAISKKIFDRRHSLDHPGSGFVLMPTGVRALRKLGIDPASLAWRLETVDIRTIDSRDTQRIRLHEETYACARSALIRALMKLAGEPPVEFGVAATHLRWEKTRASVSLNDGRIAVTDLIVGADGARSRLMRDAGLCALRRPGRVKEIVATVFEPTIAKEIGHSFFKFVGPAGGLAAGLVPVGAGRIIVFVQFDSSRYAIDETVQAIDFARSLTSSFPNEVATLLALAVPADCHVWHTIDADPPLSFARGNVCMIGDAAHPLLPFTSQGVSLALEDGLRLGELVAAHSPTNLSAALRAFNAERLPLIGPYVEAGRRLAASFIARPSDVLELPLAV